MTHQDILDALREAKRLLVAVQTDMVDGNPPAGGDALDDVINDLDLVIDEVEVA